MWSKLIGWLKTLFGRKDVGILTKKILDTAAEDLTKEILDPENQRKAYDFVKELDGMQISNYEKAKIFNKKMIQWALKCGKILLESVINCLREMAVNVLKQEVKLLAQKNG